MQWNSLLNFHFDCLMLSSSSESNAAALSEANDKKAKVSFDYTFSASCNVRISSLNNKKTFSCIRVGYDHVSNSLSRYRSHIAGKPHPPTRDWAFVGNSDYLNPIEEISPTLIVSPTLIFGVGSEWMKKCACDLFLRFCEGFPGQGAAERMNKSVKFTMAT